MAAPEYKRHVYSLKMVSFKKDLGYTLPDIAFAAIHPLVQAF